MRGIDIWTAVEAWLDAGLFIPGVRSLKHAIEPTTFTHEFASEHGTSLLPPVGKRRRGVEESTTDLSSDVNRSLA